MQTLLTHLPLAPSRCRCYTLRMLPYTIVRLEQRSAEWHRWRLDGIGASDAPTVMGENPYSSRAALLHEKLTGEGAPQSFYMSRGVSLEPVARRQFERLTGLRLAPLCLQSTALDWLRASLDGLSTDRSRVVEIKCGQAAYRTTVSTGQPPGHYYGQLQHILAVTGLESIDFVCYLPERPLLHLTVPRDEPYIAALLLAESLFWEQVLAERARPTPRFRRQSPGRR
ncbi:MAG TPA: YqaJ viral recombinase family protein, partial [Anaerolineae bacterium]|nr:YqaJ viral recombinase family protein [Anaerolineae bacterium]